MPASLIKPTLPLIVLNADCTPKDLDRQPQLIILVNMRGVHSYLKFPFRPEGVMKLLAGDSDKTISTFISKISKALIPPNWFCKISESTLNKHADKIKIDFKELQRLARGLLNHSDSDLSALGCQSMFLECAILHYPVKHLKKIT